MMVKLKKECFLEFKNMVHYILAMNRTQITFAAIFKIFRVPSSNTLHQKIVFSNKELAVFEKVTPVFLNL